MDIIHIILLLFLLFSLSTSTSSKVQDINIYNISLGIPLNITNIKNISEYIFNVEGKNLKELRVKILIPNVIKRSELKHEFMYIKEGESPNHFYPKNSFFFNKGSIKYLPEGNIRFLFTYYIENPSTNIYSFEYLPYHNLNYFYIIIDIVKPYDLPIGITKKFTNIHDYYDYYFPILGLKRFQRLKIKLSEKCSKGYPFKSAFLLLYHNKTEEYNNYVEKIYLYDGGYSVDNNIYTTILGYCKIYNYTTISLVLNFLYDVDYINIKIEANGGEILFYDNNMSKIIPNMKSSIYYFFTNTTQYQTSKITLIADYNEEFYFNWVAINLYKDESWIKHILATNEIEIKRDFANNKLIISSSYQVNSSDINKIGFEFFPDYDLKNIFVKIDKMGGHYYINKGDVKKFYNVFPGYEILFWIKSEQYQRTIINLLYNYSEENPLKQIDIYEYDTNLDSNNYLEYIINYIYPVRNESKEFSYSYNYKTKNEKTNYVLLKINPDEFLEYFEIRINILKLEYDLINDTPLVINKIISGHEFHFFIGSSIYNKLFINLFFSNEIKEPFKYIKINEYDNRNNKSFIISTNQTFEIKNNQDENFIDFTYKPINPSCKYIAVILETNSFFDFLGIKADIGGGYYIFDKNKIINKLIPGTKYYFQIKISPLQKIKMDIIIEDDNIKKAPFSYADIYEKENIENNLFNKYYNMTMINQRISGKLIEYFDYTLDYFSTNYILVELIPDIYLDSIEIKYEINNINYILNNGESININKFINNIPYYYFINVTQYQQVNIYLNTNYSKDNHIKFIEIYELSKKYDYKSYNKYSNISTEFINNSNNNSIQKYINYMVDSIYTNFILFKIKTKFELEYLNIKIEIGGGVHTIKKGFYNNITNLFCKYSYYFFVLTSKGEKLNFKLIINSKEINDPFNSLNVLEYTNKKSSSIFLQKTKKEFPYEKKDNILITSIPYQVKNNWTNFIALNIIPKYDLGSIDCFVELADEENSPSTFSIVKILTIILIAIIIFTGIIFIIYVKKICFKSSSYEIENLYKKNNSNKNEKKFELSLL